MSFYTHISKHVFIVGFSICVDTDGTKWMLCFGNFWIGVRLDN